MKLPIVRSWYVRNLAMTLASRYGSKALEALVYLIAMRTVGGEAVGLVFVASAASAMAYRVLDLGLFPVVVRSAARRELDAGAYRWLLRSRALGVAAVATCFCLYSFVTGHTNALIVSGFFLANGLLIVHELPRAVLAGHERFGALARLNLSTKFIESGVAGVGLLLGYGLPAWLLGRLLAHGLFIYLAMRLARDELASDVVPVPPSLTRSFAVIRQGLVFFMTRLLDVASGRVGVLLVTAHAGLAGAAQLGLSGKIQMAALGLIGAATQVAYPRLARDRTRALDMRSMFSLVAISLVLGVVLFFAAPFAVRILVGRWDPVMVTVVRTVAPVLSLVAINRPLELWLEAKDHERTVLGIAAFSSVVSIVSTVVLVRTMGIVGAGWARVVHSSIETLATLVAVGFVVRRMRAMSAASDTAPVLENRSP